MSKKFTAKVVVSGKTHWGEGQSFESYGLTFAPDYAGGRNAQWAAATPSLNLSMTVIPEVGRDLNPGDTLTLTFEPGE